MKLFFITLFPEFVKENFSHSILARAEKAKLIEAFFINPRDFANNKHNTVDDAPFGGGAGMLLKAEPFILAIQKAKETLPEAKVFILSPDGEVFTQQSAKIMAQYTEIIFVCGHYEGFDERIKNFVDGAISIGDYVLTGGELPAMVVSDAICRLLPGVLGKQVSTEMESFSDGLLEYPQYTRPATATFGDVPEILLSGHHANIANWRRRKMLENTRKLRPELLERAKLSESDNKILRQIISEEVERKYE
jgi:tRNA (guanine37-N1)-methyltransferase